MRKKGKITISIYASVIYGIFCILLALIQDINTIYLVMIVGAIANILLSIIQIAMPADMVEKGKEASFYGIFFVFGTITKPIASLIQGFIIENNETNKTLWVWGGYPYTFLIAAFACLISIIFLLAIKQREIKKK